MFSSKRFFIDLACPDKDACRLPNCIFSHSSGNSPSNDSEDSSHNVIAGNDLKRRKLDDGGKLSVGTRAGAGEQPVFKGALAAQKSSSSVKTPSKNQQPRTATARRSISPPPTRVHPTKLPVTPSSANTGKAALQKPSKCSTSPASKKDLRPPESLNPRMVPKDPVGHGIRLQILKKLHEAIAKLNDQVSKSPVAEVKAEHLSKNEVVQLALDEEEKFAREQGPIYANVIKLQIGRYMKMSLDDWVKLRQAAKAHVKGDRSSGKSSPPLDTGLSPVEEIAMLSRLIASQSGLDKHGYITKVPSEADIEKSRQGVEASGGWEECDRCSQRFQVFPNRRKEDGALTTGGRCTYHWGKPYYASAGTGELKSSKKRVHSCCQQEPGTPGCTTVDSHVFKISNSSRLALVMPFEETPFNPERITDQPICFDCEMGYTCNGLELIRITATSWPDGEAVLDVFVRPTGFILDLNTRFSGVSKEQFFDAPELDPVKATKEELNATAGLHIVSSPRIARDLFLRFVSSDTPVLGHALENDLNALRLVHPTIVDTVLLFPHPKGLPIRYGLRNLVKSHLNKDIQTAGAAGHDSLEDSRATGDLVRFKVGKEWKKLKDQGWKLNNGEFTAPTGRQKLPATKDYSSASAVKTSLAQEAGRKRVREESDDVNGQKSSME